jgi:hypothetical protein
MYPGKQRLEITHKARGFSASDFLHGQERLEPLPVQVAFGQAIAVRFKLYQVPMVHRAARVEKSFTIERQ